ncbi:hypothetical protein predicted by Glimmer/Critica [Lactiplantibacillus plantarum]|uniref:Uncharacterized protein n=1 Tax=Siphoviridae sp. ctk5O4 TaxID=2827921 RepID=A0A8S5SKX7_9CAUD|nr:hypothetical protein predicted by Glimmer/Critica [Lactiplantibacillus plantarum]DAF51218.1 MAG TPA: hypothetical protein [Siphoviridae sp. ctk5O4]
MGDFLDAFFAGSNFSISAYSYSMLIKASPSN